MQTIDAYPTDWLDRWVLPSNDSENSGYSDSDGAKKKEKWSDVLVKWLDKRIFAELRGVDVFVKEDGWKVYEDEEMKTEKKKQSNQSGRDDKIFTPVQRLPVRPALLNGRNLRGVNAAGAFLVKAELRDADLRKARFYSDEIKTNMEGAILINANLQGADLRNCRLRNAHLNGNANLSYADVACANLKHAILRGIKAEKVILINTDLRRVDAEGAIFHYAYFDGADLEGVRKLRNADFKGASLKGTNIKAANLSDVKNLTQQQLNGSCCDEKTVLPDELGLTKDKCLKNPYNK
jgi:uncharacterized protein YjbI with pentapeptide repeats